MSERELIPVNIAIMTISDSRTEKDDTSGAALVKRLTDAGHTPVSYTHLRAHETYEGIADAGCGV